MVNITIQNNAVVASSNSKKDFMLNGGEITFPKNTAYYTVANGNSLVVVKSIMSEAILFNIYLGQDTFDGQVITADNIGSLFSGSIYDGTGIKIEGGGSGNGIAKVDRIPSNGQDGDLIFLKNDYQDGGDLHYYYEMVGDGTVMYAYGWYNSFEEEGYWAQGNIQGEAKEFNDYGWDTVTVVANGEFFHIQWVFDNMQIKCVNGDTGEVYANFPKSNGGNHWEFELNGKVISATWNVNQQGGKNYYKGYYQASDFGWGLQWETVNLISDPMSRSNDGARNLSNPQSWEIQNIANNWQWYRDNVTRYYWFDEANSKVVTFQSVEKKDMGDWAYLSFKSLIWIDAATVRLIEVKKFTNSDDTEVTNKLYGISLSEING